MFYGCCPTSCAQVNFKSAPSVPVTSMYMPWLDYRLFDQTLLTKTNTIMQLLRQKTWETSCSCYQLYLNLLSHKQMHTTTCMFNGIKKPFKMIVFLATHNYLKLDREHYLYIKMNENQLTNFSLCCWNLSLHTKASLSNMLQHSMLP